MVRLHACASPFALRRLLRSAAPCVAACPELSAWLFYRRRRRCATHRPLARTARPAAATKVTAMCVGSSVWGRAVEFLLDALPAFLLVCPSVFLPASLDASVLAPTEVEEPSSHASVPGVGSGVGSGVTSSPGPGSGVGTGVGSGSGVGSGVGSGSGSGVTSPPGVGVGSLSSGTSG